MSAPRETPTSGRRRVAAVCAVLMGFSVLASCSSDEADTGTSQPVVSAAPLMIVGPALATDSAGSTVVVGTMSNVTDRTVEIVGATSDVGDVEFRSSAGEEVSLMIDPQSDVELEIDGVHLSVPGAASDVDAVEVTLRLDIADELVFTAER